MIRVVLIGGGNLAYHLADTFQKNTSIELVQICNRTPIDFPFLKQSTQVTSDPHHLENADIYLICVSDNAVESISNQLNISNKLVVHTSGNLPMDVLNKHTRKGVLYPVQSFSKDVELDFKQIPICIEAGHKKDEQLLKELSTRVSNHCIVLPSEKRQKLHLSAVLINNFVNHLYHLADTLCKENEMPFELLQPLIRTTIKKIGNLSPYDAQTGPARRNDTKTIKAHLELLENEQQKIYQTLTQSIQKTYGD